MSDMAKFVYDFYQEKLHVWQNNKKEQERREHQARNEERRRKLDDEAKVLREKMSETLERSTRLNIDRGVAASELSSSSDEDDDDEENGGNGAGNQEPIVDERGAVLGGEAGVGEQNAEESDQESQSDVDSSASD
jgi:hypothetical protein